MFFKLSTFVCLSFLLEAETCKLYCGNCAAYKAMEPFYCCQEDNQKTPVYRACHGISTTTPGTITGATLTGSPLTPPTIFPTYPPTATVTYFPTYSPTVPTTPSPTYLPPTRAPVTLPSVPVEYFCPVDAQPRSFVPGKYSGASPVPVTCEYDSQCVHFHNQPHKCCYDNGLGEKVCKPALLIG